jgi:hypothetical protein
MRDSRYVSVVAAVAGLFLMSAGALLAGEVAGPPGSQNPKPTAAPTHANSICSFSGLNDYKGGQTESHVQTAADSFKYYGLPHGTPGTACRGGSNVPEE